jgi:hypothetical protein
MYPRRFAMRKPRDHRLRVCEMGNSTLLDDPMDFSITSRRLDSCWRRRSLPS